MKKILFCTISILLLLLILLSYFTYPRFTNRSLFDPSWKSDPSTVYYTGKLKTLANKDFSSLYDFVLTGSLEKWGNINRIICNDCTITRGRDGGMVDIFSVVFYEEGLVEYNQYTTNGYYKRFRTDHIFTIEFSDGQTYCFVSYPDVIKWIKLNYS